jgi:hypothetical protein
MSIKKSQCEAVRAPVSRNRQGDISWLIHDPGLIN